MALFRAAESVLADDERGRIAYTSGFVPAGVAAGWFDQLRAVVPWKAERRRMYDREVDVPRLTAHYHLAAEARPALPEAIVQAAEQVVTRTDVPFNSVGLNFYRDGRDSVAPHNDHLNVLVEGFPIALLSLGSIRRMTIRAKEPPRRVLHLDLEPGSLLLMSYATQLHYTHGVPKTREPVGERISLAFRVKPAGPTDDRDPYR
ncbi:MAG TPA: alpha-ketoglutarate-dependent dioxygenase AlkB [Vicinamibacteria bacterium]|nr:alpha-ketoglutarate-dependent dioxygenase AlkB [Vicinamibacteria bacterium]